MKKLAIFWLPVLTIIFMATECDDILNSVGVIISSDTYVYNFTVDSMNSGSAALISEESEANLDSLIEAEGQDPSTINEVTLKDAKLTITNGKNFDAFGSFELKIKADGLDEIVIATLNNIPAGSTEADFVLTDKNLVDFLNKDVFVISINGVLNDDIIEAIDITATVTYNIKVGV